jgi:hypothetical protein
MGMGLDNVGVLCYDVIESWEGKSTLDNKMLVVFDN